MKAPNFSYERPATLDQALDLLARQGGAAVPLAGGQSLLATLNMRLSAPEVLVDIGDIAELKGIAVEGNSIRIGALTRHVELLRSPIIAEHLPLVCDAVRHVAHVAIRNRGTIGGSVAYADPAAELPACIVALGATIVLTGPSGRREVPADNFFTGLFETALQPGELIVEFRAPSRNTNQRWAFTELSRRRGDFAMAGLAATADLNGDKVASARLVYFGCSEYPALAMTLAEALCYRTLPLVELDWIDDAVRADLKVTDTAGLRAETKLKMATALTKRALGRIMATDSTGAKARP